MWQLQATPFGFLVSGFGIGFRILALRFWVLVPLFGFDFVLCIWNSGFLVLDFGSS